MNDRKHKRPEQILQAPYVNSKELSILLGMGYTTAKRTWKILSAADDQELGEYRTQQNKIRLRPALKRLGINYKELCDQYGIKEPQKRSCEPARQDRDQRQ